MGCKFVREVPRSRGHPRSEKSVSFNDNVTSIPPPESEPASLAASQVNRSASDLTPTSSSPMNRDALAAHQPPIVDGADGKEVVHDNNELDRIGAAKIRRKHDSSAVRRSRRPGEQDDKNDTDEHEPAQQAGTLEA